ncbi:MAG: Lacal_2735 family protein [Cytophagales bacterium]|nr:MAG: Lacal_2735 family protein [Cytophagales bacterium]TAH30850.1 MAG: Lacal_2735 family protein [Cytophagales bacterium]
MFGLFKKKTEVEKLNEEYQKLMGQAHELWKTNRRAGDEKVAEAELILKKIDALQAK